ncbi:MAG: 30S ribosomal protein S6 [Nitrospirota bacterium]|nr:30S ribosomal protein S6 [Nitrospirota bacterium]
MDIYENIVILNAELPDEEINTAISRISDVVVKAGGEILKTDLWGRKKLAYEINKHSKGYYVLLIFKTPPATIKKLEELYKVFDPVIKFMVVKLGPKQIKRLESVQAAAEAAAAEAAATEAAATEAAAVETTAATTETTEETESEV